MNWLTSAFPTLRRRAARLALAGLPLGLLGPVSPAAEPPSPAPVTLPAPRLAGPNVAPAGHGAEAAAAKPVVPISLDTVLHLAEDQNLQVAQARQRVNEAVAQQDLACRWLPDLYIGTAYYRHEGGIQLEDGPLIHSSTGAILSGVDLHGIFDPRDIAYKQVSAERRALQQKSELSRITSETLLDAANTYIDLLAAHAAKAINRELDREMEKLLKRTEELAETVPAARVERSRFRAEMEGRKIANRTLDEQIAAASARLVYLLGLDPCSVVMPMDGDLVPFVLVDPSQSTCDLVAQAQNNGPGVQELAGLVALVEDAIRKAKGPGRFMPVFEVRMTEGAFGAGPGDDMKWDNRWDMALQMRWNLTDLATACERGRIAEAQRAQAHLAYDDLRGKLTAGVREAHETILGGAERIETSKKQIGDARKAQEESQTRLNNAVEGSEKDMFNSLEILGRSQYNYLTAVREYDKAQIRLLILLGCSAPPAPPAPAAAPCLTPGDVGSAK